MSALLETVPPFTLALPWTTIVEEVPVTEVTCHYLRTDHRTYDEAAMGIGEYHNTGSLATPIFPSSLCVVVNNLSFSHEPPEFGEGLVGLLLSAWSRCLVNYYVTNDKPPGAAVPTGVQYPLTEAIIARIDNPVGDVPIPKGVFAAFRLLKTSEFATASLYIPVYRGDSAPPPS
jgi:hypothetical protein